MAKKAVKEKPIRVLSLEDSIRDFELIQELLIDSGFQPEMTCVETGPDLIKALKEKQFDIVLADFNLPEYDAYSALEQTLAISPDTPFLVVSGAIGEETAIELIKLGAADYVLKDRPKRLITAVERALEDAREKKAGKQAGEALRKSETMFANSFQYAAIGMALVGPQGQWLKVNQAFCTLLDYSEKEILSMSFQDVTHPDDLETDLENLRQMMAKEIKTFQAEKRYLKKDGGTVWALISVSAIYDSSGDPEFFITQVNDITERKQAEEALHNSEALFFSAFDQAAIGMNMVTPDNRFIKVNQAFCDLVGYTESEILAMTYPEITHPEDQELDQSFVEKMYAGEISNYQLEKRYLTKTEQVIWANITVALVRDSSGNPLYEITQVDDVTERKYAQEELRRRESLLNQIFEVLPIGLWFADAEGTLQRGNPAGIKIWGDEPTVSVNEYGVFKARRLSTGEMIQPDDWALNHTINDRVTIKDELLEIETFDGQKRIILNYTAPVENDQGELLGAIVVNNDITELKQAEGLLRESEQRYRELITSLPGVVYLCQNDEHYTIIFMTEGIKALTGLPAKDFTSQEISIVSLYHPDDVESIFQTVDRAVANHEPFHLEYRIKHTDGGYRWAEEWGTGIYEDGQLLYLEGFIADITEQKETEESLAENQRIFEVALKNSPVTVFQQDKDLRYTWLHNPHSIYSDEEQIGQTETEFFSPEDAAKLIEVKQLVFETGIGSRQVIHTSGEKIPPYTDLTIEPMFDDHGEVSGITCSSVDITKLRLADEERLLRLAELEALINITNLLRSAKNIEQAAPILLKETLNALGLQAGAIHLFNPTTEVMEVVAAEDWFRDLVPEPLRPGQGIAGQVFANGKTYQTKDYASDPQTSRSAINQVPPGWGGAAVPIQALDKTIGVFIAAHQHPQTLDPFNLQLLETIAQMAGITLHRMSLLEETLLRLEKLNAQRTIDKAVTSLTDLSMTLDIICSQALERLPADAVGVLLYSLHNEELNFGAYAGFQTDAYSQSRIKLGEGYAGQAALDHQTVHLDNIAKCDPPFTRHHLLAGEKFTCYTGIPLIAKGEIKGMMEIFHINQFHHSQEWQNDTQSLSNQTAIAIDTLELYDRLQRNNLQLTQAYDATIEGWSLALDLRDHETEGHTLRVTDLTVKLAYAMGVSDDELVHIRRGALLHDMGKLGVPDSILLKPGSLTEEEWEVMREHPRMAYNMLSPVAYLRPALDIPYSHHEKWDGTGYPNGLKGAQIPLSARIFAVVDVFDALTSDRPYRDAWPREKTLALIQEQTGTHFDPQVVEAFFKMIKGT